MPSRDQVLAEVLDSLIKQDTGKIPPEVGELVQVGVRLHNECPDIDPGFMGRLGGRLEQEWVALQGAQVSPSRLPAPLASLAALLQPRPLQRGLAILAAGVALAVLSAVAFPGLRSTVRAGLGRMITVFQETDIEQQPRLEAVPWPTPVAKSSYVNLEQAQAAAGFALRAPTYLPDGLEFHGAVVTEIDGRRRVALNYAGGDLSSGTGEGRPANLVIQEIATTQTAEQVAFSLQIGLESAQPLQVAGRPALWVSGNWRPGGRWAPGGRDGLLMFQDGDVFLIVMGSLGREETARIAASMVE